VKDIPPMPEKSPLIDPQTGLVNADWQRWFKRIELIIRGLT